MDIGQVAKRDGHGFTMIELLMVVTIIGILLAIAVPRFLGARRGANDRAARTTLDVVAPDVEGKASHSEVSVLVDQVAGHSYVILTSRSTSGACFALLQPGSGHTQYQPRDSGTCTADSFDPVAGWSDRWQ